MKKIWTLMATVFVDMLGFAIVFPLLPFYALELDAEPWVIGLILAIFSVAQIITAPLWGRFSDRFGRRPAIILGLFASMVAFIIFAFADSIALLFISRLIQGAGGGTTGVAQAYVGDSSAPGARAKTLGWLSAASAAGIMLGPAIGSLSVGLGRAVPGLIAAGLCALNIVFAWRWLREPEVGSRSQTASSVERRPIRTMILTVLTHPGQEMSRLIWIYAVAMLGFMSVTSILALYLGAQFGITATNIGWFFLFTGALSLVLRGFVLGRLLEAFGEVRVMRFGAVALAVGLALMPWPQTVLGFVLALALVPLGTACLFPTTTALVTTQGSVAERGQTLGVQQAFGGIARVIAPIWATAAFQGWGHGQPFLIASAVVTIAAFLSLGVGRQVVDADSEAGQVEPTAT